MLASSNEYFRKYYQKNKGKVKQIKRNWVLRNRLKVNENVRKWRKNNPDKVRITRKKSNLKRVEKNLEYSRRTRMSSPINGKKVAFYRLNKRTYPKNGCCEICKNEKIKRLGYHHWDDKDLKPNGNVKGIWVCFTCHNIITYFSMKKSHILYNKYLIIKKQINASFTNKNCKAL